jgi:hypothetical protein
MENTLGGIHLIYVPSWGGDPYDREPWSPDLPTPEEYPDIPPEQYSAPAPYIHPPAAKEHKLGDYLSTMSTVASSTTSSFSMSEEQEQSKVDQMEELKIVLQDDETRQIKLSFLMLTAAASQDKPTSNNSVG